MSAKRILTAAEMVLSTLILACLVVALGVVLLGPRLWGLGFFTIYGGSMEPTIPLGALAIVRQSPADGIGVGDVIAFRAPGEPERTVTHRVVEVAGGPGALRFRTQGDANDAPDAELVPAANVVGVVVGFIPLLGYVTHYSHTPLGTVALLVGLLGFLWLVFRQEIGAALHRRPADEKGLPPGEAAERDHMRTWLLLLAAAGLALGAQQFGAARGSFSATRRAEVRVLASTWAVPTTLEVGATATAFVAGLPPAADGECVLEAGDGLDAASDAAPGLGVRGQVTLRNSGSGTTDNLQAAIQVQYRLAAGEFQDLAGAAQALPLQPLGPGAAIEVPYEIRFQRAADAAEYRVLVQPTITNYAGHMGQPFGPQAAVTFSAPALPQATPEATPTPAPTPAPTPTETPEEPPVPGAGPASTATSTGTATVPGTATPTATIAATETGTPAGSPVPGEAPAPTETGTPTDTPTATETPTPNETAVLTETPAPTETATPAETPTATVEPADTATATPSLTEAPTEEARPMGTPSPEPAALENG